MWSLPEAGGKAELVCGDSIGTSVELSGWDGSSAVEKFELKIPSSNEYDVFNNLGTISFVIPVALPHVHCGQRLGLVASS
jgi:hypothetical protein